MDDEPPQLPFVPPGLAKLIWMMPGGEVPVPYWALVALAMLVVGLLWWRWESRHDR